MNEGALTKAVLGECIRLGLLVHHCRDSRQCSGSPGMPDLVIASRRGVLFAELKGPDGDTRPDQDRWLYALHLGGVPYTVWCPADWDSGTVQARLGELAD